MRHGEISVQLHTPDAAAQDALRDGLADLRRQLEEQGLRTGSMEVGSGGPQQHRRGRPPAARRAGRPRDQRRRTPTRTRHRRTTTALDLRM